MVAALTTAREALAGVVEVQPVYMTPAQQEAAIVEASALEATAAALRVLAVAEEAADAAEARDAGGGSRT